MHYKCCHTAELELTDSPKGLCQLLIWSAFEKLIYGLSQTFESLLRFCRMQAIFPCCTHEINRLYSIKKKVYVHEIAPAHNMQYFYFFFSYEIWGYKYSGLYMAKACFCRNLWHRFKVACRKNLACTLLSFVFNERHLLQDSHIFAHICALVRRGFPSSLLPLNGISVGNTFATQHVQ